VSQRAFHATKCQAYMSSTAGAPWSEETVNGVPVQVLSSFFSGWRQGSAHWRFLQPCCTALLVRVSTAYGPKQSHITLKCVVNACLTPVGRVLLFCQRLLLAK
jgi:hypothetical protein